MIVGVGSELRSFSADAQNDRCNSVSLPARGTYRGSSSCARLADCCPNAPYAELVVSLRFARSNDYYAMNDTVGGDRA